MSSQDESKPTKTFKVPPTGPGETTNYTDTSITSLFISTINMANVEKQVIWNRYAAMLVANSVVFVFIGHPARQSLEAVGGSIFGILMCICWWIMNKTGWNLLNDRLKEAQRFQWTNFPNPVQAGLYPDLKYGRPDWIFVASQAVVVLFLLAYLSLAIFSCTRA